MERYGTHFIVNFCLIAFKRDKEKNNGLIWFHVLVEFIDEVLIDNQRVHRILVDVAPGAQDWQLYGQSLKRLDCYGVDAYQKICSHFKFKHNQVKIAKVKIYQESYLDYDFLSQQTLTIKATVFGKLYGTISMQDNDWKV